MKTTIILIGTAFVMPWLLPSCGTQGGAVAAGAIGGATAMKLHENKKQKQRKEDLYWHKQRQKKKR